MYPETQLCLINPLPITKSAIYAVHYCIVANKEARTHLCFKWQMLSLMDGILCQGLIVLQGHFRMSV